MDIKKLLFVEITGSHTHTNKQNSQDTEEEEIRLSINLPYVKGASIKLQIILTTHKIRSTFYPEKAFPKVLCKPKVWVDTTDQNKLVDEIDCGNCEAVFFR